jgi:hypothetical protein
MWVVGPLGTLIFFFAVAMTGFAAALIGLSVVRLFVALFTNWRQLPGAIIGLVIWGGFGCIMGTGAFTLASAVADGFVLRVFG